MARVINNKYLFIHAAKTGGTFFRECLNRYGIPNYEIGLKHAPLSAFPSNGLTPIMFIRHPVDWYISRWRYGMLTYFTEKIKYIPEAQNHWMAPVWSVDVIKFIENTLTTYPDGIATKYFTDMFGDLNSKQITKIEHMAKVLYTICMPHTPYVTIDVIKSLPKVLESNRIPIPHIPHSLTTEIIRIESRIVDTFYP